MNKNIFIYLILSALYSQLGHTQKIQFDSSKHYRYDESPFFLRGIYQLDNINIVPNLAKGDSSLLVQSVGCINLIKHFNKNIDRDSLLIEITQDSIKFLNNSCILNNFQGFFEQKLVKSFSTTHNPEKPGYITFNLNLIDKNGFLIPAIIKFPQLTLEFRERFISNSNVYLISGKFYMIKYRHPRDNSLRPVLKRVE